MYGRMVAEPAPLLLQVSLVQPADDTRENGKGQHAKERLHAPLATRCHSLSLAARREIVPIRRLQICRQVRSFGQLLRSLQPLARMGEPGSAFAVGGPIA